MSFDYNILIQEATPALDLPNIYLWVKPSTGTAFINLNMWIQFAAGEPIAVFTEGNVTLTEVVAATRPTGVLGLIWVDSINKQSWIYLSDWIPFLGG